jgi:hypothetical protein
VIARSDAPIEPMTLGNMREHGVRSRFVSCWICQHEAVLRADLWPDDVAVPTFGSRMVCAGCVVNVLPAGKVTTRPSSPARGHRRGTVPRP